MGTDQETRTLKGLLAEVFFPALTGGMRPELLHRLGVRATLDDPRDGRATGRAPIEERLLRWEGWLADAKATWTPRPVTPGIDRDVAEGTLTLSAGDREIMLPVAIVVERHKAREVDVRVYHSMRPLGGTGEPRARLLPVGEALVLPKLVADHLAALETGSVKDVLGCFEADGILVDGSGKAYDRVTGSLEGYWKRFVESGACILERGGYADGGKTCGLEYTLTKVSGNAAVPSAGLLVYERGGNGLIRTLRVYDDALTPS